MKLYCYHRSSSFFKNECTLFGAMMYPRYPNQHENKKHYFQRRKKRERKQQGERARERRTMIRNKPTQVAKLGVVTFKAPECSVPFKCRVNLDRTLTRLDTLKQYSVVSQFVEDVENEIFQTRQEEICLMAIGSPLQKKSTSSCFSGPISMSDTWKQGGVTSNVRF